MRKITFLKKKNTSNSGEGETFERRRITAKGKLEAAKLVL